MTFSEFSQQRIFGPMGMSDTRWRDDFTEIVKLRSVAYRPDGEGSWKMLMPLESVFGNGGLITSVSDLLKFTHNLETGEIGGSAFVEEMHRQGVLNSDREISYASGLTIGEYKGVREVSHSGATAGYRGFLTRFPDHGLAVSVMCNAATARTARYAHEVAELLLDGVFGEPSPVDGIELAEEQLASRAGKYLDRTMNRVVMLAVADNQLSFNGLRLTPKSTTEFRADNGIELQFQPGTDSRATATISLPGNNIITLEPVSDYSPTRNELENFEGKYVSEEAEATFTIQSTDNGLEMLDRYGDVFGVLEPLFTDAFAGAGGTIEFKRGANDGVVGFRLSGSRVWDLSFTRVDD